MGALGQQPEGGEGEAHFYFLGRQHDHRIKTITTVTLEFEGGLVYCPLQRHPEPGQELGVGRIKRVELREIGVPDVVEKIEVT